MGPEGVIEELKKTQENIKKIEITKIDDLPLTFKEWEKIDNLFRNKNGNTFNTFL